MEREKPVIPASEIMRLPDLCCYVRLPGANPIVQLNMPYIARPAPQAGFLLRAFETDNLLGEVEQMLDKHTPVLFDAKPQPEITAPSVEQKNTNDKNQSLEKLFN